MKRMTLLAALATLMLFLALTAVSHGQTVTQFPNGISTGKIYDYDVSKGWAAGYYMDIPTLTANDEFVGKDATQTLTNKTLTNPTIIGNVSGYALKSEARTATTDGAGDGKISAGITHVVVTSDDANKIITLPSPVPGLEIWLINGATGYELRTSAPATIGINAGVGDNAESAIGANTLVVVRCVSATAWIGATYTTAGVVGVVAAAAP